MQNPYDVSIAIRVDRPTEPYRPLWNWFGYDEPNYTYSDHGKKLLRELSELSPEAPRIRTHNLLSSGNGTAALKWGSTNAYSEDATGDPVYNWTIMDKIFDAYVEAGTIPLVQIGFTPEALSNYDGPYQHSWKPEDKTALITTGWASPPNDLKKWGDLVEAWARHLAERYGEAKVSTWPWEVWNEPDGHYWLGTIPQFCELYDVSARAVKRALPKARVGGPHTCGAFASEKARNFLRGFLQHVVDNNSPIDFLAFHAKGNPVIHQDHVRMGLHKHLNDIQTSLAIINEFPTLTHLPVVIGESDPEGCAACGVATNPENAYRNGTVYSSYTAEQLARTYELADLYKVNLRGSVTWAFEFEGQPYFAGFRDLATNGVDKPVLNVFRMLGRMSGDRVAVESSGALPLELVRDTGVRDRPDINALATRGARAIAILVWNYHDDDVPAPAAEVDLTVEGVPATSVEVTHDRVDATHSNAYEAWKRLGSPQPPTKPQHDELERAGRLQPLEPPRTIKAADGRIRMTLTLPRQAVSLIRLTYLPAPKETP